MSLNYADIEDYRYNPFTGEFSPKQIGYGAVPPETRVVPESSPYWIKLYEIPQENSPSTTRIIRKDTSLELTEVSKTTSPSTNQYRVNYDEQAVGIVEVHASLKGVELDVSYYGLGHIFQKISLDTRAPRLIGEIITYPLESPPENFLECDGSSVSRTTYADLFGVIGTSYGSVDANSFNLPDYRGIFLRGWRHGKAGVDPDSATRTDRGDGTIGDNVGTKQTDQFKAHAHTINLYHPSVVVGGEVGGTNDPVQNGIVGTDAEGGLETRPANINVIYCIRYN